MATVEPINVFDLPQLYTKPSYAVLIGALAGLKQQPASWVTGDASDDAVSEDRNAVAAYLTRIISSGLAWLSDDEREEVFNEASSRLSERAGRTGMSSLTRTFKLKTSEDVDVSDEISIEIHEPGLTEDNLGLKTWASAFMLAQNLLSIGGMLSVDRNPRPVMLELGSGTGLVGMAAAALLKVDVTLTDLPEIVVNLKTNVSRNEETILEHGGSVHAEVLDWAMPLELPVPKYDFVIAADPLYSYEHPAMLHKMILRHIKRKPDAHVIVMYPLRDKATEVMGLELRQALSRDFILHHSAIEQGHDDWEKNGVRAVVQSWWGVWRWNTASQDYEDV